MGRKIFHKSFCCRSLADYGESVKIGDGNSRSADAFPADGTFLRRDTQFDINSTVYPSLVTKLPFRYNCILYNEERTGFDNGNAIGMDEENT